MALKLGKGSAFVKTRLRRLPQNNDTWEADFLLEAGVWSGMVVECQEGIVMAMKLSETAPTVNDLARLLANAMERPLVETHRFRPQCVRLRDNSEWQELVPHLQELGIEVVIVEELAAWDNVAADCRFPVLDIKNLWFALRSQSKVAAVSHADDKPPGVARRASRKAGRKRR